MPVDADIRSSRWKLPEEPAIPVRVAVDSLRITVGSCADRSLSITGRHLRSEHLLDGLARGELAIDQCLVPSKEVVNCGVQRACRIGNGHVHVVRFHPWPRVSRRMIRWGWKILVVTRIAQMKYLENLLLKEARIGLARHLVDDGSQNHVAGIAVVPFSSRGKIERLALESGDLLSGGSRLVRRKRGRIVGDARRVREQVLNRDRLPGGGTIVDIEADGVLHAQLALLLQEKNCHCGKLRGD